MRDFERLRLRPYPELLRDCSAVSRLEIWVVNESMAASMARIWSSELLNCTAKTSYEVLDTHSRSAVSVNVPSRPETIAQMLDGNFCSQNFFSAVSSNELGSSALMSRSIWEGLRSPIPPGSTMVRNRVDGGTENVLMRRSFRLA